MCLCVCVWCVRFFMKGLIGTADGEGWVWDFLTLWAIRVVLRTCGRDLRGHAAGAGVLIPLKMLHLLSLFPSDFAANVDQSIHPSFSMSNMAQSSRSSHFPPSSTLGLAVSTPRLGSVFFRLQNSIPLQMVYKQRLHEATIQLALIAQLVERVTSNDEVAGSTPS